MEAIRPKCYVIYAEDFNEKAWIEYCENLKQPISNTELRISVLESSSM